MLRCASIVLLTASLAVSCSSPETGTPSSSSFAAQIEDASSQEFSGDRAATYNRIAGEALTQDEQVALVNAVQTSEMFSRDQCKVMHTLIANSATTRTTCEYILSRLNYLALTPEDRLTVSDALKDAPANR